VDYATVTALFVTRRKWTAQKLDSVLTDLEDRGLLGWDRAANTYDLHPIVRGVVWTGLDDVRQRAVYGALEKHFSTMPKPPGDRLSLDDAHRAIELFNALVGLGRYDDAARLYLNRLNERFDFSEYGIVHVKIALLESLFPDGLDAMPRVVGHNAYIVLSQLSHAYNTIGRLREAYATGMRSVRDAPIHLQSVMFGFSAPRAFKLGRIEQALRLSKGAAEIRDSHFRKQHAAALAVLEAEVGNTSQGLQIISKLSARKKFDARLYEMSIRLLRGEFHAVIALEAAIKDDTKDWWPVAMAGAEARIRLGRPAAVIASLMRLLRTARSWAYLEYELECMLLLAEAHRRLGGFGAALAHLEDIAEPAARGEYRFYQAKAAVILAEVERDRGNRSAAVVAAAEAYRLAWCDGPPYTYYWTLKRAEELLGELGGAIPQVLNPVPGVDEPAG
jgi:tetratricopeptide (TPR) repeat protein